MRDVGGGAGKLAVIVGAIVVSVLIIAKGFDGGPTGPQAQPTTPAGTETPTTEPTESTPPDDTACQPAGVGVQVFNGTSVSGLAAFATGEIEAAGEGWVLLEPDDTEPTDTTVVYFRTPEDKPEATCLRDDFFLDGEVKKLPAAAVDSVDDGADIAVFLGNDYALAHPQ
jgi:hypothetical protein